MEVSFHAKERYMERAGIHVEREIRTIVEKGTIVYPTCPALALMNNRYEEATYYHYKGLIAVVVDDKVLTVFNRVKKMFKEDK